MPPVRFVNLTILSIVILCCFAATGLAQTSESGIAPSLPHATTASYYYIGKPGELTMQVNLWGFVKNPGRYEVPSSTDLIQLISYAGGPILDATMDDVRVTRVVKKDSAFTRGEYRVNLADLYRVDPNKLVLYPGDTIFIDHSSWVSVRDALIVITAAAIVTSAVAQVINVTTK